jgi:GT2 family glycosyltransferase
MVKNAKLKKSEDCPLVYAVVLNWCKPEETNKCLTSLLNSSYPNLEIVIVDNASTDDSIERISKEFPLLKLIISEKNGGYASGMNIGVKYALENKAKYVLLTNNDMLFDKNFLEPLVELAESNPRNGIISPKVLYRQNPIKIYCAGGEFNKLKCVAINKYRGKNSNDFGNEIREIISAEGSCLLASKEVFLKVGMLNEEYFMYYEDLDFSLKVRKYFKLLYMPKSNVYHEVGAGSNWRDFSSLYYYYFSRNRLIFCSKISKGYYIYGISYSFLINSLKTIVLLSQIMLHYKNRVKINNALRSIWKGYIAGLKYVAERN